MVTVAGPTLPGAERAGRGPWFALQAANAADAARNMVVLHVMLASAAVLVLRRLALGTPRWSAVVVTSGMLALAAIVLVPRLARGLQLPPRRGGGGHAARWR